MEPDALYGPGYSARLQPGSVWRELGPWIGANRVYFPPGAMPQPGTEAVIRIEPVPMQQVAMLLYYMNGMQDPFIGMMNAQSMGVSQVLGVGPMRSAPIGAAMGHIREFDGIGVVTGQPYRFTMLVLVGSGVALKLTVGIRLHCWARFTGPCLAFVASISLGGAPPATDTTMRAVVDPSRPDQVEYQLVNPDHSLAPITAMPIFVGQIQVLHIDQSIKTGDINGVGVVVGAHSTSTVTQQGQSA